MGSLLSGLLNQTIDKISSVTTDAYGDVTKSSMWENVPCRFELASLRSLGSSSGRFGFSTTTVELPSYRARAWLYPEYVSITRNYIITKDDEDYRISSIEKHYNLEGELDHLVLVLE